MNLAIDFGNTRVKAALFRGSQIQSKKIYNTVEELIHDKVFYSGVEHIILGTVTDKHLLFINSLPKEQKTLLFEASTPIPLKNLYQSASTLGSDRIAASVGAFSLHPGQNV